MPYLAETLYPYNLFPYCRSLACSQPGVLLQTDALLTSHIIHSVFIFGLKLIQWPDEFIEGFVVDVFYLKWLCSDTLFL